MGDLLLVRESPESMVDDRFRAPLELVLVYQKATKESVGKCHGKWEIQVFLAQMEIRA